MGRILIALAALTRTAGIVAETSQSASKAARAAAARAKMRNPNVRRLYLMRRESAAAVLDALREHRNGTPRGHWVRGHRRHQWYASVEEHRWQWICLNTAHPAMCVNWTLNPPAPLLAIQLHRTGTVGARCTGSGPGQLQDLKASRKRRLRAAERPSSVVRCRHSAR